MTVYEPNSDVRPTGAEPDELVDAHPGQRDDDQPGLDTDNLPGDNRAPASARPWRERPAD